jgi:hypothetical protein
MQCYCKDQAQRIAAFAATKQHNNAPTAPKLKQTQLPFKPVKDFDPLTYSNSRRQVNVNPNLKPDVNHNPNREPCTRCGDVHRYKPDCCTAPFSKDRKKLDALEPAEVMRRLTQRWNDGFFFLKPLNVNPNLKPDVNHNPNREPCTRCGDVHRYKPDCCTAPFSKDRKKLDALEPAEVMRRLTQSWNDGFFFLKPLEAHAPKSPSVAAAAKISQDAAQRLAQ